MLRPRIQAAGFKPGGGGSAAVGALLRRVAQRYAAIIRAAGIRLE